MHIPLSFTHNDINYIGFLNPVDRNNPPRVFHMVLNDYFAGTLTYDGDWRIDRADYADIAEYLGGIAVAWHECPEPAKGSIRRIR